MQNDIKWIIRHRVLRQKLHGQLDLTTIRECMQELALFIEDALYHKQDRIVMIFDVRELDVTPDSLHPSQTAQVFENIDRRLKASNQGFIVVVTSKEQAGLLMKLLSRIFSQPMTTTEDLDEAFNILKHMYPSLRQGLDAYAGAD